MKNENTKKTAGANESTEAQANAETTTEVSTVAQAGAATEQQSVAIATRFDATQTALSKADLEAIAFSGVFEEEGVDLSSRVANDEYWETVKGTELNVVFETIVPWESNDEMMEDTDAAVCQVISADKVTRTVTTERILILNAIIVSEFKRNGAGAYKITYLGKKPSKKNSMFKYSDFAIKLQRSFVK